MRVLGFGVEGNFAEFYLLSNLVLENALRFSKDLPPTESSWSGRSIGFSDGEAVCFNFEM